MKTHIAAVLFFSGVLGADGKTDPASWGKAGPLAGFDNDAVFDSGSMTRPWPFK